MTAARAAPVDRTPADRRSALCKQGRNFGRPEPTAPLKPFHLARHSAKTSVLAAKWSAEKPSRSWAHRGFGGFVSFDGWVWLQGRSVRSDGRYRQYPVP